ncbi:hypothetical protein ACIBQX_11280 [Nonomuraea sp. NPDC049714]|uniref:hypothetical protein n=1 Tax=Nonomuraea sp. NPDC049714 TaxID=3364357 RepID=UPI0037A31F5B
MADRSVTVKLTADVKSFIAAMAKAEAAAKKFRDGLGDGSGDPFEPYDREQQKRKRQAPKEGDQIAGAFAKAFSRRLEAAFKSLPKAELDADASEARQKLQEVRASLQTLSSKQIGLDIDAGSALAEMANLHLALDRLSESAEIDVRADTMAALTQLQALQREIDKLGEPEPITPDVDVNPARTALEELKARMAELNGRRIGIDLDAAAARTEIAAIERELQRLNTSTTDIDVQVDTVQALSELRALESSLSSVSGRSARINVDADVGGALSAIAMVGAALASLPAVTSIAVGVSVLGAAFTAAGAGAAGFAAVAVPSLGRINEALKQQASAAGGAGGATKSAGQSAAEAASRALQLEQAERRVADAQKGVKQAQEDLTRARRDAKRALDDLTLSVKDAALAEQDAALSVEEARQRLAEVQTDPDSDELDVKRAELNYRMSVQRLEEQSVRTKRLKEDQKEAAKAGVEGSDQVRAAQDKLLKAETDLAMASKQLTVLKLQQKAAMESAGGAAGGAASKMAELSKAERALAKDVKAFQDGYVAWQRSLQPDVFPAIRSGMDLMSTGMKTSTPLVKASAAAFDDFLKQANKELKSEQWQSFFRDLTEQAPRAIDGLGDSALNVAGGLTGIVQAFLPFTDELMDNLEDITQEFEDWGQSLDGSPEFEAFIAYVRENGPKVAEIFGNIATFAGKIVQVGADVGPGALDFFVQLSEKLADLDPGQIQAIATGIGLIFAAAKLGTTLKLGAFVLLAEVLSQMSPGQIQALAVAIAAVVVAVKGFQAVSGAVGFFSSFGEAVEGAGKKAGGAQSKLANLAGVFGKGGLIAATVAGVAIAFDQIGDAAAGLNPDLDKLATNLAKFGESGQATQDVLDQLAPKMAGLTGGIETFADSAARLSSDNPILGFMHTLGDTIDSSLGIQLDNGKQAVDNFDASLSKLVAGGNAEQAAVTFKRLADQAIAAGTPVEKLKDLFPQYAASMDGIPATTGAVGTAVELLGGQVNGAQREIGQAAERLGVFRASLDEFNSQTDAAATVRDMEKAFNDAKTAIDGANGKLTLTPGLTAAQRDAVIQARDAFAGYVEKVRLSAEGQVTLTGRTTEARDAVLRQLPAMIDLAGKNEAARNQVLELAKAYGISESDAIKAAKGGQNLVEVLAKLKSKDIRVGADVKPAQEAIDNFVKLNSGRKIPLHVYTKNSQLAAGAIMRYAEGGLQKFASGGRATPAPHIADSPTILYGEGNGPEAFIPYDPAFRDRAMDLVSQVASDFGGKFVSGPSAGSMGAPANSSRVSAPQRGPSRGYATPPGGGSAGPGGAAGASTVVNKTVTFPDLVVRESADAAVLFAQASMHLGGRG